MAGLIYKELWHSKKVRGWSDAQVRLWIMAISFAEDNDTKGFLDEAELVTLAAFHRIPQSVIAELADASVRGLDRSTDGRYRIHNYAQRGKLSRIRARAGKVGADSRWHRDSDTLTEGSGVRRHFINKCALCGVLGINDLCHIEPRSRGGQMVPENLVILCPTHHRMFDSGQLSLEDVLAARPNCLPPQILTQADANVEWQTPMAKPLANYGVEVGVEERIFQKWCEPLDRSVRFTDGRRRVIRARLRDGFTEPDLLDAAVGWLNDPWPDRPQHNDLTILFRNGEQVEKFRDLQRRPPVKPPSNSRMGQAIAAARDWQQIADELNQAGIKQ